MDNNKSHAEHNFDYLVLGSGIAGLFFALKACKHGSVAIITKKERAESNTNHAQGGIAAVTSKEDSVEMHIQDTLIAGAGLCDEEAVRIIVTEGPARIADLISYGTHFTEREIPDSNGARELDLGREGGHSKRRVLHAGDITGHQVEIALLDAVSKESNICFFEHHFAIDLILSNRDPQSSDRRCIGAYVLDAETNQVETFRGKHVILATGGCGKVYLYTTNPYIATGDGLAMAWRAGAAIANMEFIQFHPTALYHPGDRPSFLITEAMRGYGAVLRTLDGKEFMQKYDPRLSLAPRDIVARAIDNEMKMRGDDHVYLDVTHKDADETRHHFPNIYAKCKSLGIDITKDYIPVAPAAHYLCGGIKVDLDARSSIDRLYAVGECSCTGLHGGNRLASNSLIEAVVYADAAARHSMANIGHYTWRDDVPEWNDEGTMHNEEMVLITQSLKEVNQIMSAYVGIVRSNLRLDRAWNRLDILYEETEKLFKQSKASREICELRNLINVGYLIMRQAKERHESRGLHYSIDYPPERRRL